MPSPTDVLRIKTDAELQFFVDNPGYYHADLVAAARQELRRRGVAPLVTDAPAYPTAYADGPAAKRPLLIGAAVLVLAAGGAGLYWKTQASASAPVAASRPGKLSPDSLKLEAVAATPIPNFDNDRNVDRQLALVPAAERAQASAQQLRQYQGLSLRFWRAQNPTAYLLRPAGRQPSYPVYTGQLNLVQAQWNDLYKGLVYSYNLPPTMMDHLARMRVIARIQRATLKELQADCASNKPLELTGRTQLIQDTAQHLLAPLQHRAAPLSVRL